MPDVSNPINRSNMASLEFLVSPIVQVGLRLWRSVLPHMSRELRSSWAIGGARRDRTADLLRARQALSQLSYSPDILVGLGGFEPPTSPLSGVRSNQLSYRPGVGKVYDS